MTFQDLREFYDGSLRLPVAGKTYVVPPVSHRDGLWAQTLFDAALRAKGGGTAADALVLDDHDERNLYQRMLGAAYEEMVADGLDWPSIARCGQTVYIYVTVGEDAAVSFWESGAAQGEAPGPNRAARRSSRTTSSRSGRSTPKAALPAGTTSRRSSRKTA